MATTLQRLVPGATKNPLNMNNHVVFYLSNFFHLMCLYPDIQFLELPPPEVKASQDRTIYDYFISYRHKISAVYAHALWGELVQLGYRVYFAGEVPELSSMDDEQLKISLQQELHQSSVLIIMGSDEALEGDWVKWEMNTFSTGHWGRKIPLITNDLPAFNVSLRNIHRKDPSALFLYEEDHGAWEENKPSATTILCLILAREFFRVELQFWDSCAKIPAEKREQAFFDAIYFDKVCNTVMRFFFEKDRNSAISRLKAGYLKDLRNYKEPWWKSIIGNIFMYVVLFPLMFIYMLISGLYAKVKRIFRKQPDVDSVDPGSIFIINPVTGASKEVPVKDFFSSKSASENTNSGLSYDEQSQLEKYKKEVAREEAKSDTMNEELPRLYTSLANLFHKSGDYTQAAEYYKKALLKNNIIANFYEESGDFLEAIIYYKNALDIKEKGLMADDPLLGAAYDTLANKYTAAGMPSEALIYHFKGLKISQMVLAPTDPDLGKAYYNTAITYSYLGDLKNCYEFMQRAINIWEKVLPANNEDLIRSQQYFLELKAALNKLT
ncbi:tetratricopeptide repeat protein [Mucilaginibacter endophyticus]|uniref:tetratricopeptide repeat protein n=1 Tax=Mucilaginibacter endophyticus TaxID=2675003 RepID=UPI000E0DD291|nr:tetratricopeptide repeat protein [Mucilaginibacter endophyticus]